MPSAQHEPSSEAGGGSPTGPNPRGCTEEIGAAGLALREVVPEWPPLVRGAVLAVLPTALFFMIVLALRLRDATEVLGQVQRRLRRRR